MKGQGVEQDYKQALKWYLLSAKQGHKRSQLDLGVMFENGEGVSIENEKTIKWYRLAAEQGNAKAQHSLGIIHKNGQGVPQDYQEAFKWYRFSAEQGNADSQYSLGLRYYNGEGIPRKYKISQVVSSFCRTRNCRSAIQLGSSACQWKRSSARLCIIASMVGHLRF